VGNEQTQGQAQERARPPEAEQAGQPAGAGQALGQALQPYIMQAFRPVLAEFYHQITQAVQRQKEQ